MIRRLRWAIALMSLAILAGAVRAQSPNAEYQLRAGDIISVDVWGFKDFSVSMVPVRPDGKISFPTIGDIYVVGQTPLGLSRVIALGIGKYIKNPKVSVTLVSSSGEKYYVTGAVVNPGAFPLTAGLGVREAIVAAGDLKLDANDQTATILRNGERINVDLGAAMKGDAAQNLPLQAGDTLSVDQALVTFLGAVANTGQQPLRRGATLRQALAAVGDLRDGADVERIQILRGNETIVANLRKIIADPSKDVPLKPGDIIKVDVSDLRSVPVLITGAVGRQSPYRFVPGYRDTVQDAIVWAGGVTGNADLSRVKIRRTLEGQKPTLIMCDARTVEGRSVRLMPNDYIEVPGKRRSAASSVLGSLSGFLGIGLSLYSVLKKR